MEITKLNTIEDIEKELADTNAKIKKHLEYFEMLVQSKIILKTLKEAKTMANEVAEDQKTLKTIKFMKDLK